MRFNTSIILMAIIWLPACTWIDTTEEGEKVDLVEQSNVSGCKKLGTAHVSVTHKLGIFTRTEESVKEDLVISAKNNAAERGADSIVEASPVVDGRMSFDIYKCR
jgi:hypothetical protein